MTAKLSPSCLFCFDFDGTLVDEHPHPACHPRLNGFLEEVKRQGGVWAINTGRTLFQTLEGLAQHAIRPLPDFILAKEREMYQPGAYNRWHDVGDWNKRCHKEHRRFLKSHQRFFRKIRAYVDSETAATFLDNHDEPPGIVATSEIELASICEVIDAMAAGDPILSYQRNSIYLRFAHRAYDKGAVLSELSRLTQVGRHQICVAGDNHNDLSMLRPELARFVVCPSNAIPEVKAAVAEAEGYVARARASFGVLEGIVQVMPSAADVLGGR